MKIDFKMVFTWPRGEGASWSLLVLIFLMLVLHSAAFFLFQAVSPEVKPPPRMAPPVQLLTGYWPDGTPSPENEALLRWIESVDPAVVANMPEVAPKNLLDIPYRPSYATMLTRPLGIPLSPESVQFPPARNPMALILGGTGAAAVPKAKLEAVPTRIFFASPLAGRVPAGDFKPQSRTSKPLEPTRFLVGVNGEGKVRFVFPQRPDQREVNAQEVEALEGEALDYLTTLVFKPKPELPISWGLGTIEWGDDVAAAP